MWWPERDILAAPLHQNELDIDHEITPDGIAVWGAIPGQRCDSTRAEIIAATAMLAAPIPCHVGIDNLNTVRFANFLIQNIDYLPRKPFGLIPNGDVLQVFQEHLRAKLTSSVLVSKVKGHATPEDVLAGLISVTPQFHSAFFAETPWVSSNMLMSAMLRIELSASMQD